MINEVWFYSIYPCFAVICCSLLLYKAWRSDAATVYLKLFFNLALINFFQVIIYIIIAFDFILAGYAADAYLISAYFLFTHFMQLALYLSEQNRGDWTKFLYIPSFILMVLHLSGLMVESYYLKDNAILHNDGSYAVLFDGFIMIAAMITIVTFIINTRQIKTNTLLASKNIIAIISFIPFVLVTVLLIILSNTEHTLSVVIIVPSVSLYIVFVFYYISRSQVIDLTIGPRAFIKRLKVASLLLSTLKTKKDLDNFNRQLQVLRYNEIMQKHKNNYNAAAEELKMHPTTLRNALKEQEGNA